MRTRNHDWFDTKNRKPVYSFQVLLDGQWLHASTDGKPAFFNTPEERDAARKEARKLKERIRG